MDTTTDTRPRFTNSGSVYFRGIGLSSANQVCQRRLKKIRKLVLRSTLKKNTKLGMARRRGRVLTSERVPAPATKRRNLTMKSPQVSALSFAVALLATAVGCGLRVHQAPTKATAGPEQYPHTGE